VLVGDFLYGDTNDNGTPFCADLMTGEIKWKSRGSGKKSASVVAADGHIYVRYANGTMTLVKADPAAFQEVGSFKVPGSGDRPSWAHPVIADGRLYLREGDKILCYSITDDGSTAAATPHTDVASTNGAGEMLTNGNFAKGKDSWEVEKGDGESAKVEIVKEGPNRKSAIRIEVVDVPDEPWQVQMNQPGIAIEKGKPYVLTFWTKSNRDGTFKVMCMQNHEPWEHETEQEIFLSTEWKKQEFAFIGPWNDQNARVTFTDLGTDEGRIFWFANCSLRPKSSKE